MSFPGGFPISRSLLHDVAAIIGISAGLLTIGRFFYVNKPRIVVLLHPKLLYLSVVNGQLADVPMRDLYYFFEPYMNSNSRVEVKFTSKRVNIIKYFYFTIGHKMQCQRRI